MTENELRSKVVSTAESYLGFSEANERHKEIIDLYNTIRPLPRGYAVKYTDDWCATFVSAMFHKLNLLDIAPAECGCPEMIEKYRDLGRWEESDSYVPKAGDVIFYDWDDSGTGENYNDPEHVGIVCSVSDGVIKAIDGNWNGGQVAYHSINVNGTYIRGFGLPNYASKAGYQLDYVSGNRYLTQAEMEQNAWYIWDFLGSRGWSMQAVAGMLGNMETESTINPGIWQSLETNNTSGGFGIVQWTPATKLIEWANENGLDYTTMDAQLLRIIYELDNGLQYYPTNTYPETFAEFKVSTKSPYYLGMAFLANYERPAVAIQVNRGIQAQAWYKYLSTLPGPGGTKPKKKGLPLILMYMASRRRV